MASVIFYILGLICIVQFAILYNLLLRTTNINPPDESATAIHNPKTAELESQLMKVPNLKEDKKTEKYKGVAICLLLHSPTWFQRRFTVMARNIRNNIPPDWAVQFFYTAKGQSQNGIDINKGFQRMIENGDVFLTLIPPEINNKKKKAFELMTEKWIWENVKANRVLVFNGNTVICGNSLHTVETFAQWDYIGSPWKFANGLGGDGGISLRNAKAMISVIDYELEKASPEKRGTAYKNWGQEDQFFVSRMLEMNEKGLSNFKVASPESTNFFSAIGGTADDSVLTASGTLAELPYDTREKFIAKCIEIKVLFPVLHDPNCFGAQPNAEKCAKSICALQDEHKGGCPSTG